MSQFKSFDSIEKMVAYMTEQTDAANETLADKQREVTYGSYWARFDQEGFVVFGYVPTLAEATESTPESEKDWELKSLSENHERGYMFSKCFSVVTPNGEYGDTHRANLWPIPQVMFDLAGGVGWDVAKLEVDYKMALWVHHRDWLAHARSIG